MGWANHKLKGRAGQLSDDVWQYLISKFENCSKSRRKHNQAKLTFVTFATTPEQEIDIVTVVTLKAICTFCSQPCLSKVKKVLEVQIGEKENIC